MSALVTYNVGLLVQCWANRLSGAIRMVPTARLAPINRMVPLADGGIRDAEAWAQLLSGIDSHVCSLVERSPMMPGNRRLLGALLAIVCRRFRLDEEALLAPAHPGVGTEGRPKLFLMPAITLPPFLMVQEQEPTPDATALVAMREHGRRLLESGAYAEADRVLSGARDLRMDHAPTLALLALARFRNPNRERGEGRRDAEAMAKMAWLLAPEHPDVKRAHDVVLGEIGTPFSDRREQAAEN